MTRTKLALFSALVLVAPLASAGMIDITMTGAGLTYSDPDGIGAGTGTLTDSGAPTDPLALVSITEDGNPVTLLQPPTQMSFDLSVGSIPSILIPAATGSTSVTAPAGGSFDLFLSNSSALSLTLDEVEVTYTRITSSLFDIRVFFTGTVGSIDSQALPAGVELGEPVTLSFNIQQGSTVALGDYLQSYTGSGTGIISAERIPEPSTLLIAGLGGMLAVAGIRARSKK
jgi:hypothetical protein